MKLRAESYCFHRFPTVENFSFSYTKAYKTSSTYEIIVFCSNLEDLISYVISKRKAGQIHFKFGLYGEEGFLKPCLSIQTPEESARLEGTCKIYE